MSYSRKWIAWQGSIEHESVGEVNFKAVIEPAVHAAHIGADHPDFISVGKRAECVYFDLYDDFDNELPYPAFRVHEDEIRELIRKDYLNRKDDEAAAVADRLMTEGVLENSPTLAEVNYRRGYPEGEPA